MIIVGQIFNHIIKINEGQKKIFEDVYINGLNTRKKQAQLTYDNSGSKINRGNLSPADKLKTDKMNQLNGDTYEVPLKGGIMSYNITSISGTEVMHYFKRYFGNVGSKTELAFKNEDGKNELYELVMQDSEMQQFINDFKAKVKAVVDSKIKEFTPSEGNKFTTISIYPVPSSSNFNVEMAGILKYTGFDGMKVQTINSNILKKDTSKLKKDEEFIEKNKEYYSHQYTTDSEYSHEDVLNTEMNKLISHSNINDYIDELNELSKQVVQRYNSRNKEKMPLSQIEKIGDLYGRYVTVYNQLKFLSI